METAPVSVSVSVSELWMPVEEPYGNYSVSIDGRVKRVRPAKNGRMPAHASGELKLGITNGYKSVSLSATDGTHRRRFMVHRLVAQTFLKPPIEPVPKHLVVNHKDHNRFNNCVANLEYVSQSDNVQKAHTHYCKQREEQLHEKRRNDFEQPQARKRRCGGQQRSVTATGCFYYLYDVPGVANLAIEQGTLQFVNKRTNHSLKPYTNYAGYPRIVFDKKHYFCHRLVCAVFHGPAPSPEHVVNHKDKNRANYTPHNLEWTTQSENMIHAHMFGKNKFQFVLSSLSPFLSASVPTKWLSYEQCCVALVCRTFPFEYTFTSF